MSGPTGNEPKWLVPNTHKPRQRLRSIGPVLDLSKSANLESGLSQSLQSLTTLETTPIATIAPILNNNPSRINGLSGNVGLSAPNTPHRIHSNHDDTITESETTSLPDELRHQSVSDRTPMMDYVPRNDARLHQWTPAAPRRATRVSHSRDYGSASSIDHFNPEYEESRELLQNKSINQSQPFLLTFADMKEPTPQGSKRKKNFLSHSRERLDNFVGKFAGSKQKLDRTTGTGPDDSSVASTIEFRAQQQRKRREGTLSPRSNEYSLMLKRMANVGPEGDTTSSGYEGDCGSDGQFSTLSRDQRINRRRWFAHYDCESLAFEFIPINRLLHSDTKRSVIASGASAAIFTSALASEVGSEDELRKLQGTIKVDRGDGNSNLLVKSCPQFRNEIGGVKPKPIASIRPEVTQRGSHIPSVDGGKSASLFEGVPRPQSGFLIEAPNLGQDYYKQLFFGKDHTNYICEDEKYGPICISLKREKLDERARKEKSVYIYRIIVRTASLMVLKGSILEELVPLGRNSYVVSQRDVLMHLLPEININNLRKLTPDGSPNLLINLDSKSEQTGLKIGVLLCKAGQSTEEEMYNNQHSTPLFDQFLQIIGTKITLEGFTGFRAGLDVKGNSTGVHSVYTSHRSYQIMFHVSTMLPFSNVNKQQVDRKRHIGNDVITVIFQEPGAAPFSPAESGVRSQFQHIFIIVRAHESKSSEEVRYSISVTRAKCVPAFGPDLPDGPIFTANDLFRDFILTKLVNGHNSTPKVGKFGALGKEMRFKYLKNMIENNIIENSTVDGSSSRFSILPFRRIEKRRGRVPAEIESRGALIWHIEMLVSGSLHQFVIGISHEALCIVVPYDGTLATGTESTSIELVPGTAVFSIPPRSILGWACLGDIDLEIYFGKGDSFQFSLKRKGEMSDLIQRLECASRGKSGLYPPAIKSKEINVTRPSVGGQLGFHVAYEGFVNQVDNGSAANKAGLLKGSRIVAIQSRPLSKLSHRDMIDILRSESRISLRVLPPVGQKEQPRYTPRELANSIPRIPTITDGERELFGEDEDQVDLTLAQSESIGSMLSNEETQREADMINEITRSHAEIVSNSKNDKVKMRSKRTYSPKRQLERKASFERKRKSFEAKRHSGSGLSEELNLAVPKVLSRDSSPMPEQTQSRPISLSDRPRQTTERRSWHGGKLSDSLTAADLLNIDKFEREPNSSPNDTASSGENRHKNNILRNSPLKSTVYPSMKSTPETSRRALPKHLISINKPRNEIIFFKSSGSGIHPPSKRKEKSRNRSLPRSSDKVTKDLLKLITEPLPTTNQNEDSTDDDPPEHLPEADRQFSANFPRESTIYQSESSPKKRPTRSRSGRRKSLQDPITDERLHRIEKTLREMQIKLDEEQTKNNQLESEVATLRHENHQMKFTKTHRKQDYV